MIRTDLAVERREMCRGGDPPGVRMERSDNGGCVTTVIEILNEAGAEAIQKPVGKYITLETDGFPDSSSLSDGRLDALCDALEQLLPREGHILAVGLGNTDITPDALGPECASQIIATRHLPEEMKKELGLPGLRTVSVLTPGVAGKTGIESTEIIASVVQRVKPAAVLTVDALAARSVSRLAKTVQLCDTGIQPGSGVGNSRKAVDDFSVIVNNDQIKEKNYSFSAGQYFDIKIDYVDITAEEFEQRIANYKKTLSEQFDESHRLEKEILKQIDKLKLV